MAVYASELEVKIGADTTEGERKIRGFVDKQSGVLQRGFGGIGAAVGLAATTAVVGMAAKWANEAAEMASYATQVKDSFSDLAANVGQSSDEMLDALKATSQGGIAEYDLMLSANKALMLGVADTTEEMTRLMEIAMQRGQALGLTDKQAFDDIVTGLGRGSALILDNLGIMIDLDQAYASYGATLGKTADELTDVEKKQATVNAAMRDVGGRGGAASTSPWEGWNAAASDFSITLGEIIGEPLGQFMRDAAAGVRELDAALDAARERSEETKQEMEALADTARLDEVRLQVQQLERDYANLVDTMGQAKADEIFNTDYGSGTPAESLRELLLLLGTLDGDYAKSAAEWSAGEDARTQGLLRSVAAAEAAVAIEKQLGSERIEAFAERGAALKDEIAGITDAMTSDMSFGQMDALNTQLTGLLHTLEDVNQMSSGSDAALYGTERQLLAIDEIVSVLTDDMATVDEITAVMGGNVGNVFDGLLRAKLETAQLREEMEATAEAQQSVYDGWNQMAGIVEGVQQQLAGVIGESAFDNFDEYESKLWDVFNAAIEGGRTTEEAFWLTEQAADELVSSVTALNGGTLDEVAAAAFNAEQNLWGTAAAAQAVMDLVGGTGQARLQSLYMGTIGQGNDAAGALAGYNEASAQLDVFKQQLIDAGVPITEAEFALEQFVNGYEEQTSAITGAYREQQRELRTTSGATKRAGTAAKEAADGLSELSGMLSKIPGLFDTTAVTQDDLDAGANYKDKADEYLRRLRDEVQNGKDWEGVDIGDAAAALGLDPSMAAEQILKEFEAAWQDSSLFANPENMKFIDMDAVQASLEQQLASAEGEKNLKALFGIGENEDVNAVAALGLDVQSGLAQWLTDNGLSDAGLRLAEALGGGIKDSAQELGGGVSDGLTDWGNSPEGQGALLDWTEWLSDFISANLKITPNLPTDELPPDGAPPTSSSGGTNGGMGATPSAYGAGDIGLPGSGRGMGSGVNFTQQVVVRRAHEAKLVADYTAQEMYRRSRR